MKLASIPLATCKATLTALALAVGAAGHATAESKKTSAVAWFAGPESLHSGWAWGQQYLDGGTAVAEATVGFNCVSLVISAGLFITGLWAMRVLNSPEGKPPEPSED